MRPHCFDFFFRLVPDGAFWSHFCRFWSHFGRFWSHLGAISVDFGAISGCCSIFFSAFRRQNPREDLAKILHKSCTKPADTLGNPTRTHKFCGLNGAHGYWILLNRRYPVPRGHPRSRTWVPQAPNRSLARSQRGLNGAQGYWILGVLPEPRGPPGSRRWVPQAPKCVPDKVPALPKGSPGVLDTTIP
jgi:hypothetical protein